MKTREKSLIPFLRHDLFSLFAQYLPTRDLSHLEQSCYLANQHGIKLKQKVLADPNLLLKYLAQMDKQMMSRFLQEYFHPSSPHYARLQNLAAPTLNNFAAVACYSLMAAAEWVKDNQASINRALNFLNDNECITSDCLQQSLGFMLHPNVDLRTRLLMHKLAFYNLRGQQLFPNEYNLFSIDLSWANFAEANLHVVDLRASNLKGVCFRAANLEGAFLVGSNLQYADLSGANLQHAHVDAWNHPFPEPFITMNTLAADFRGAIYNSDTEFPERFSPKKHGMHNTTLPEIVRVKACVIL